LPSNDVSWRHISDVILSPLACLRPPGDRAVLM